MWHNLYLFLHVSEFLIVCTLISTGKWSQQDFAKFSNEVLRKGMESS